MNRILAAIGLAFLLAFPVAAQTPYRSVNICTLIYTNNPNDITNVGAAFAITNSPPSNTPLGLGENESFGLDVFVGLTNASTASIDIRWCTSFDGVNYCNALGTAGQGWFSIPLTNATTAIRWHTNWIAPVEMGYWKLDYITNKAAQHMTNLTINAYFKPVRHR